MKNYSTDTLTTMQSVYIVSVCVYILAISLSISGSQFTKLLQWDRWYWRPLCPAAGIDKVHNDCPPSSRQYRAIDGSCNNDFKINWGKTNTPLERMSPANFSDGRSIPRVSHDGSPLPNPRQISLLMMAEDDNKYHKLNKGLTSFVMDFGQFLIHDISHSPVEADLCRNCSTSNTCLVIPVAENDPSFSDCIRFRRSKHGPSKDCEEQPWQPLNTITSFIDMSHVYGNNDFRANELRDRSHGTLMIRGYVIFLGMTVNGEEEAVEDEKWTKLKRALVEETEDALANSHSWLYSGDERSHKRTERSPQSLKQLFSHTSSGGAGALAKIAKLTEKHAEIARRNLVSINTPLLRQLCDEVGFGTDIIDCSEFQKYRSINGSCNNLIHVHWGQAMTTMPRFLPPDYADDVNDPREAPSNRKLPNPRLVSSTVVEEEDNFAKKFTTLVMHFGQFLDHDIGHSPEPEEECHCETTENCLPIEIPKDDTYFTTECIPFARSVPVPASDCRPGPRQQLNQVTSFLDLSSVYGSLGNTSMGLRVPDEIAYLKSHPSPRGPQYKSYLPPDHKLDQCVGVTADIQCSEAGDLRTSEQPGLTAMHTIFMRQHNSLARTLKHINRHWKDNKVFQEARSINSAIWQRIIYKEFLPVIVGQQAMVEYNLAVMNDGFFFGYSGEVNPSTSNVFSHAAFRFGHSLIPSQFKRVNSNYEEVYPPIPLKEAFFNASHLFDHKNGGMDAIVLGMLSDSLSKVDTHIDDDVTKHLFANPAGSIGLDLVALNIQRGRDHGLPGYNEWRHFCGLRRARYFEDLRREMSIININQLRKVYEHVDDIDPFIALISETPVEGALVGKTLGCILGKQFANLKFGDRFWFENGIGRQAFTADQLGEIRKMTMARVLCENVDDIQTVQPRAFEVADEDITSHETTGYVSHGSNKRVSCHDYGTIPNIRLHHWIEYNEPSDELYHKASDLRSNGFLWK
ncbi:lactoperoxidase-like [Anneissia japonica]|uniref:lactoperoxidase-like n=1 Tax=Anneissia japonica TaxID=1529436 RepID=UPI0014257B6D|nr:lactoperoxidase-like [Anneissia japonica]